MSHHTALSIQKIYKSFYRDSTQPWPWSWLKRNGSGDDPREIRAIDGVSLNVRRGEIVGVLGASGSGKSTLMCLISTLLIPDSGTITVFGHDTHHDEVAVKRMITHVATDTMLFREFSALENLAYAARLHGLTARQAQQEASTILERLRIGQYHTHSPLENMSWGMQQKVSIARALLTSPMLLLLDDPTSDLDPRSQREVQEFVRQLRQMHDVTVLLTTHDPDEAERLCDRIAILDEGRIVAFDTPARLKATVERANGHEPTMADAFMALTGKRLIGVEDKERVELAFGHVL